MIPDTMIPDTMIPGAIITRLRARYAEPHRGYHGQSHIDALLHRRAGLAWHDPAAVEIAIWFHDAIYRVPPDSPGGNERASAALLAAEMAGHAEPGLIARATSLVLATERHAVPDGLAAGVAADCALFLDLDLAILGAPAAEYDRYAAGVAFEYLPALGEAAYRKGRAAFLRGVLPADDLSPGAGGRRLFLTDAMHHALGAAALANMRRELAALEAGMAG